MILCFFIVDVFLDFFICIGLFSLFLDFSMSLMLFSCFLKFGDFFLFMGEAMFFVIKCSFLKFLSLDFLDGVDLMLLMMLVIGSNDGSFLFFVVVFMLFFDMLDFLFVSMFSGFWIFFTLVSSKDEDLLFVVEVICD